MPTFNRNPTLINIITDKFLERLTGIFNGMWPEELWDVAVINQHFQYYLHVRQEQSEPYVGRSRKLDQTVIHDV